MRKNEIIVGIYRIASPTGKVYIGLSRNILKRWAVHREVWRKDNNHLVRSMVKYGAKNHVFEILHRLPNDVSDEVLSVYEILYGTQHRDLGFKMFNMADFGGIPPSGKGIKRGKHSAEQIRKNRESHLGQTPWNKGKKWPQHVIEKQSQAKRGKKNSEASKIKNSISNTGKKRSAEFRERMRRLHIGKKKGVPWTYARRLAQQNKKNKCQLTLL